MPFLRNRCLKSVTKNKWPQTRVKHTGTTFSRLGKITKTRLRSMCNWSMLGANVHHRWLQFDAGFVSLKRGGRTSTTTLDQEGLAKLCAVQAVVDGIPKEEYLRCFESWLKRLKLCIEVNGNYFEGL